MKKEKLILPISIILGCIILGSFYYVGQLSKQKSIEKQERFKIQEEKKFTEDNKNRQQELLNGCLADVEERYFSVGNTIKESCINCEQDSTCGVCSDAMDKNNTERQQGKDNCFKQYSQN